MITGPSKIETIANESVDIGIYQKEWLGMLGHARKAPKTVSIWTCVTHHYKYYIDLMDKTLSRDERERAARFRRQEDRDRYVLSRLVIRKICADWFAVPASELDFGVTALGRPFLKQAGHLREPQIDFNLSHSGDCTIVAWSPGQRVGVDIERRVTSEALNFTLLAEKAFSPHERGMLARIEPHQLALTFYKIWARKEALLKAEGCGLSAPMSSFSVVTKHDREFNWAKEIVYGSPGSAWTVVELATTRGYVAALATRPRVQHFQYPTFQ